MRRGETYLILSYKTYHITPSDMSAISLRLPEDLEAKLDAEARREGLPRSEIAREAIAEFLARKERERVVAAFVAEARAAYGDATIRSEAIAIAEEALQTDNEALEKTEARKQVRARARGARGGKRR